ncbi:hypothetical protein ACP3V3_02755 [Vibrio sp. PNB22_3_1]
MFAKIFTVAEGRCQVVVMIFKSEPDIDATIKLCFLTLDGELATYEVASDTKSEDMDLHKVINKPGFQDLLEEVVSHSLSDPVSYTREQGSFATIYTEHEKEECVLFMSERSQTKMYLKDDEETVISCLVYGLDYQLVNRLTHAEIHYYVAVARGDLDGVDGGSRSAALH